MALALVVVCGCSALPLARRVRAQVVPPPATRLWRADERTFVTDLSVVTAIAATRSVVYVAVPGALGVYDRAFRSWKETIGPLDGYPAFAITAMAADPNDDTAWLAGAGLWLAWSPFLRRLDSGPLPGGADAVVLDARDPSRGAYFHGAAGWSFVPKGALAAQPAYDVPPRDQWIGGLTYAQLVSRLPALDAVRFRLQRDQHLRDYRLSAAAVAPLTHEIYVGTDGNGAFAVDPLSYAVEALPLGVLGAALGAVATRQDQVCVASDARGAGLRRGITCFDAALRDFHSIETVGLAGLPGTVARGLLVTPRAVWAATDQGLVRADRRGDRVDVLTEANGLPSSDVLALAPARGGVWVGTMRGLALVADTGGTPRLARVLPSGPVEALAEAWDTLWAGTPSGLALLPPNDSAASAGGGLLLVQGPAPLREPIVALAWCGDTLIAATAARFVLHAAAGWRVTDVPGRPIGRIAAMASDAEGVWVAGSDGLAYFAPARGWWSALVAPGDVPHPVRGVAATGDWVFAATDAGLVRYARRIFVP